MEDYSQAYDFIYRIDKRITALEDDATRIERIIDKSDASKKKIFADLRESMDATKNDLASIKKDLNALILTMVRLSKEMKNSLKKDQVEALSSMADDIQFNEFLTKKSLESDFDV